jgi:hypothetical protein
MDERCGRNGQRQHSGTLVSEKSGIEEIKHGTVSCTDLLDSYSLIAARFTGLNCVRGVDGEY